jgi:hypothetical protein
MDAKWKPFEKLARAIRMVEQRGAKVSWGQAINGVPFDAVVLRSYGDCNILIVADCVSSLAPISKAQMDHFVGKSQQANAHIAIFVSQTEFSIESLSVAGEHSIWLLSSKTMEESSLDVLAEIFQVALNIYQFRFRVEAGNFEVHLPEEPGLLKLGMQQTRFEGPGIDTTPEKLVEGAHTQVSRLATGRPQIFRIPFPKGTVAVHPNVRTSRLPVTEFSFTYGLITVCGWGKTEFKNGPYLADPTLREELAKRSPSSDPSKIEGGFDTKLRAGKFYYNPKLHISYFCERVKNGKAAMALIESRQTGMLVQARWNILTEDSRRYVEITEQGEIQRLKRIYEIFAASDKNLDGRFDVFARNLEGAESLDDLVRTYSQEEREKLKGEDIADYFFKNREIICEYKSIQKDISSNVEKVLEPYMNAPDSPIFYGEHSLEEILEYLPDRDKINAEIIDAVTDSIERAFGKANGQIRDTKKNFDLQTAKGLLVILNDLIDVTPDIIVYRVRRCMNKRTASQEIRFPHVTAVLIIHTAHYMEVNPQCQGLPILVVPSGRTGSDEVMEFLDDLIPKWSAFEGHPLFNFDRETLAGMKFKRSKDERSARGRK